MFSVLFFHINAFSQNSIKGSVNDEHSGEPLAGVNVLIAELQKGTVTGEDGMFELTGIPDGSYTLVLSYLGFEELSTEISLPLENPQEILSFELEVEAEELEEVTVSSSRTSRTIKDIPTRIEVIASEELDEKMTMEPSNISMLLNESSGIYVQSTSATSGNASISIQGLEGRYTQLLKNGFPLYGGYSGSLSIMQIPPVDLSQVEIIKGSASTLYGAGAIAGMVNLISKEPAEKPERSILLNMTSASGFDATGFFSGRSEKLGYTFSGGFNSQRRYDADKDNFSDLPEVNRFTAEPRLFYYFNDNSSASLGISFMNEERTGGDIFAIDKGTDPLRNYMEINRSQGLTSQFTFTAGINENDKLTFRNSLSSFSRSLSLPQSGFEGRSFSSYSEASYLKNIDNHSIVFGLNLQTESFTEEGILNQMRDYSYSTAGGFIQDIWKVTEKLGLETGLRADYTDMHKEFFILPRFSSIYNLSNSLSFRIGGGLGYKVPTIFTERSEKAAYRNVLPLGSNIKAERSYGLNFDVNYKSLLFNKVTFSLNQALYYTRISSPVMADPDSLSRNIIYYKNSDGSVSTSGFETNLKFSYGHFKLYTFYTYIYARENSEGEIRDLELTPKHKLGITLFYEKHGSYRVGLEGYYTGKQRLSSNLLTRPYWITGLMAEKQFRNISVFVNFENFSDTRQSRFSRVVDGPRNQPVFSEIWAPLEGFIINGGVKLRL